MIAKKNPEELQGLHLMHFKIEQICKGKSVSVLAHWACLVSALFHPSLLSVSPIFFVAAVNIKWLVIVLRLVTS